MSEKKKKNMFKGKRNQNLKQNNRWSNFQKASESKPSNTFKSKRFEKFNSDTDNYKQGSKFRKNRHSKFGRKRIYESRMNKEQTMDYFKNQKNATQKTVSLFDFTKNKTSKKTQKQLDKPEQKKETMEKYVMSQKEKNFIISQYCYEEDSGEEEDAEILVENDKVQNKIIDF